MRFIAGEQRGCSPGDGHVALIPAGVPATVQAMVVAGNELQELPYGPGGHPDPLRREPKRTARARSTTCCIAAGVRPLSEILADNPLAQDYVELGRTRAGSLGDDLRDG